MTFPDNPLCGSRIFGEYLKVFGRTNMSSHVPHGGFSGTMLAAAET